MDCYCTKPINSYLRQWQHCNSQYRKGHISITLRFALVDSILMIHIHQISGFQVSTTEMFKISTVQSWHTQKLGKIQNLKFSKQPTLPEIESLVMLAYQKVGCYWPIFCSRRAKIVTRLTSGRFCPFHVYYTYFLAKNTVLNIFFYHTRYGSGL